MGTLKSTSQPQSRQCRDEVSRKRFSALGKSRVEMLPSLPFFHTTLLLLSHTAAPLERVPRGLYPLTFIVSNQPPLHQHLREQTTNRPQPRSQFARQKLIREEPHPSWTKRGQGDLNDKWSPRQSAKQPDRTPVFLPTPQLTSHPLNFPLGRDPFQLPPPPPPTPSLRRALRWPPWPPDPHRWSRPPPILGGGMQKAGHNLLGRDSSRFWPTGHWHTWGSGSPTRTPGIPREPTKALSRWAGLPPRSPHLHRRKRAHKVAKRGPLCMRRCLVAGLLHPAQCHALC